MGKPLARESGFRRGIALAAGLAVLGGAAAYGGMSAAGVLTAGDPSTVLREGSLLMELSGSRSAQTTQLLTAAGQLAGVQQQMQRTRDGIATLRGQLAGRKKSLGK